MHKEFFEEVIKEAGKALCKRDRCGAVIVLGGKVVGRGYNGPPNDDEHNRMCEHDFRSSTKPRSDRTCCVHAEWRAIMDGLRQVGDLSGASLYFARVDENGVMLYSGVPYCTVCSRLALDCNLAYFGLWHENGIRMYETAEYNRRSYAFHSAEGPLQN